MKTLKHDEQRYEASLQIKRLSRELIARYGAENTPGVAVILGGLLYDMAAQMRAEQRVESKKSDTIITKNSAGHAE